MKSDSYLTLCLEQAKKSPLHYKHGAIVVCGGKVIGQGYNDYRPGFNSGSVKTGRLPRRSLDGQALAMWKEKRKSKLKRDMHTTGKGIPDLCMPCEASHYGGKLTAPLSMHSEMMAIHSAISASSTSGFSAVSYGKKCFKLSGDSKKKNRLRGRAIRSYVEAVCVGSSAQFVASQCADQTRVQEEQVEKSRGERKVNNLCCKRYERGNKQQSCECPQYENRSLEPRIAAKDNRSCISKNLDPNRGPSPHSKDVGLKSIKNERGSLDPHRARGQSALMQKSFQDSHSVKERMKQGRLHGADLYVARLLPELGGKPAKQPIESVLQVDTNSSPPLCTGSLHEELVRRPVEETAKNEPSGPHTEQPATAGMSRPCYRCILYMESAGIKRVFWTTDSGDWEGAKIRELVDAVNGFGLEQTPETAAALNNVFVTKHEVQILRRVMENT
ncbi:hypothetical protein IQ07DRAFT_511014 [Pyrenochaeta sp. DS3sAY3a]|nr:hypothetical protein IQ07DRAFT_511014 [Pyrenochaeta sp. DS3sAY3a]